MTYHLSAMASQTLADRLDAIAERLSTVAQQLRSGAMSLERDTHERTGLVMAGMNLVDMVSQPKDKMLLPLVQFAHFTAVRMFIKWKVFEKIPLADGAAISYGDLAAQLGADLPLISKTHSSFSFLLPSHIIYILAMEYQTNASQLASRDVSWRMAPSGRSDRTRSLTQNSPNSTRRRTPFGQWHNLGTISHEPSVCLNKQSFINTMTSFDSQLTSFVAMPKYFDHFGMVEPTDRLQTVVSFAEGQLGSTVWEIIHKDELRLKTTTLAMGAVEEHMPALGSYDLSWAVQVAANSEDRPLVVDVGGGKGQALKSMFAATPGLPRHRCVLEDLAEVVEASKDDPELADVKRVAIDFHKDQPVKGTAATTRFGSARIFGRG